QPSKGYGIKIGRMGVERAKHALDRSFDKQIVVDLIDESLAHQLHGILKDFKAPIELGDVHGAKVGGAYIESRDDPGQGREHQIGPELGIRVAEPREAPCISPSMVCGCKMRRKCANEITHLSPSSAHPAIEQGSCL